MKYPPLPSGFRRRSYQPTGTKRRTPSPSTKIAGSLSQSQSPPGRENLTRLVFSPQKYGAVKVFAVTCLQWRRFNELERARPIRPSFGSQKRCTARISIEERMGKMVEVSHERHSHS